MMSTPNTGPEHPGPTDPEAADSVRRANPASAYHDEFTGVIEAASTRATTVSHRFGSARHALTRPDNPEPPTGPEAPEAA
jgi:hypothetical protein